LVTYNTIVNIVFYRLYLCTQAWRQFC